jgi:hypothetical protein
MSEAKVLARANGTSLNQFLSTLIAERVGEMRALAQIEARGSRADVEAALAILDKAPERPPHADDEI